jgi:hypothetical protein
MRTITRRLGRLEEKLAPRVNPAMQRAADILAERQRRRGLIHEPLDWASLNLPPGTRLSCAETMRLAHQLRRKRDRERQQGAGQIQSPKEGEIGSHNIPAA